MRPRNGKSRNELRRGSDFTERTVREQRALGKDVSPSARQIFEWVMLFSMRGMLALFGTWVIYIFKSEE